MILKMNTSVIFDLQRTHFSLARSVSGELQQTTELNKESLEVGTKITTKTRTNRHDEEAQEKALEDLLSIYT